MNHTHRDIFTDPRYIHRHVGGRILPINKQNYLQTQMEMIKKSQQQLPPVMNVPTRTNNSGIVTQKGVYIKPNEDKRYDPYNDFLYKRGLLSDGTNKRRYKTTYVDINSAYRVTEPGAETEEAIRLTRDPLDFDNGSNEIFILHEGHSFSVRDSITLTGAVSSQNIQRTTFRPDETSETKIPSFEIPASCNFMKIWFKHGLPSDYEGDEIVIELSDIKGDRGNLETSSFLGNIPTNVINSKYPLKLTLTASDIDPNCDTSSLPPDYFDYSPDYFFIVLPKTMHDPPNDPPYILRDYNYKIKNLSIAGVPLSLINAEYPITPERRQGYHNIIRTLTQGYFIKTDIEAILDTTGGGANVFVSRVSNITTGYPNPNNYIIDLGKVFHNVLSARLVSMEFPNSEQVFKTEEGYQNNKIYWNDIDDGDHLYSIEVPAGNYTPSQLTTVLETLFFNTPRVNSGSSVGETYTPNHFIQVNIDTATDRVSFRSYKEYILVEPIIQVSPEISTDPALDDNPPDTEYILTIRHPGHGMTLLGEVILISGAIEHLGIPANTLNGTHTVTEIVDDDNYKIQLPRINLGSTRTDSKGGVSVTIFIPDLFRMRFDQTDTMGGLLGFRNPGDENSITPFNRVITNADPYEFDIDQNAAGETIQITNNSIQLSGDDYVIMVAKPLETYISVGPIKSAFAKIILCDTPGKVIFNSFVPTHRFYDDILHELSDLEIAFYTPNGKLYNFNGLDHSFTLEIITVQDIPQGTGKSANTGQSYGVDVPMNREVYN